MTDGLADSQPQMIDHWWWRPGWSLGRQFFTWHLTFGDAPDALRVAHDYGVHLDLPGLDIIPDEWLHLTMQGIGFVGEVAERDVERIVDAAHQRLSRVEPFTIALGPAIVDPEVVRLQVNPADPVRELRNELRAAIADVWGSRLVPENPDNFTPHVSLAYSNRTDDMQPILDAVNATAPAPGHARISHADLIQLNRDNKQYQWTTYAEVPLG